MYDVLNDRVIFEKNILVIFFFHHTKFYMYELYFEDHNLKNYFYVFISDIALNFRTSFIDKSGHVVYDGRLIVKHYVKGWFLLDLLAAIPFDLMFLFNRFSKLNTVSSL